ncbi:MAG TPA: ACT domain-containing protein [Phycisphaerae bacterium]|nr:ACT domain-containing protein [Phycisphaerae bacterium]HPS53338.1 ACT domain-containing protein [Phycisphaerae bacterium]
MKIKQLSVFLENKPGQLNIPCKALASAGLNILTLSLADTHQFGILRLILEEPDKGKEALEAAGCVVNVTEVVAVTVPDRPGGLAEILDLIEKAGINLEYMYAFTARKKDQAILVFRFEDPETAIEVLQKNGISVINRVELFDLAK